MRVCVKSLMLRGMSVEEVDVEVAVIKSAIPVFEIVGLASKEVQESVMRIKAAFENLGFKLPHGKITVNLSPADVVKKSSAFDLAIATGILVASGVLSSDFVLNKFFVGEIGLDGKVKPVRGIVAFARYVQKNSKVLVAHPVGILEIVRGLKLVPAYSLKSLENASEVEVNGNFEALDEGGNSFSKILLTDEEELIVKIASAFKIHALFIGPPGSGKTFMGYLIASLKPPLSYEDFLEVTSIYEYAGFKRLSLHPPVRSPHFTLSYSAMFGGGKGVVPGEISLAHKGILFLDEMAEFPRRIIEGLRQPLADGKVLVSRADGKVEFPADFQLIGTMNPCPCGKFGYGECSCSFSEVRSYLGKISSPMADRIDISYGVSGSKRKSVDFERLKGEVLKLSEVEIPSSFELLRKRLNTREREFFEGVVLKREWSLRKMLSMLKIFVILKYADVPIAERGKILDNLNFLSKIKGKIAALKRGVKVAL